jgi:hypothetical protein
MKYSQRVDTKRIRDLHMGKCLMALMVLELRDYLMSLYGSINQSICALLDSIVLDYTFTFCRLVEMIGERDPREQRDTLHVSRYTGVENSAGGGKRTTRSRSVTEGAQDFYPTPGMIAGPTGSLRKSRGQKGPRLERAWSLSVSER